MSEVPVRRTVLRSAAMLGALAVFPAPAQERDSGPQQSELMVEECRDVAVRGKVAYVALSRVLSLQDVSNPGNPRTLSRLTLPGSVQSVAVEGTRAFLGVGSRGLLVVDVSDPKAPRLLIRHDTSGSVRQVALSGSIAFLADGIRGIDVVDLSDPERPRTVASVPTRSGVRSVAVEGRVLVSAEGESGARVFDVGKPGVPRLEATLDQPGSVVDARFCGPTTLLMTLGSGGIRVYDLASPTTPRETAAIPTDCPALSTSCSGSLVAVSCGDEGVELWDVANRDTPRLLSAFKLGRRHPAGRSTFAGELLFVAAYSGGLGIVDLKDPARPEVLVPRGRKMNVRW